MRGERNRGKRRTMRKEDRSVLSDGGILQGAASMRYDQGKRSLLVMIHELNL